VDWQRQPFDPPRGAPDPGPWQIHIALKAEEKERVQAAAPRFIPAERFELRTELVDGGDGDTILALRVFAESSEQAEEEAASIYRRIREAAGLPRDPVLVLGYLSPWWRQPRSRDMGKEALELLRQDRNELAVIRVQTACELRVAETLTTILLERHPEADANRLVRRPATLRDEYSRALFHLVTGKRIQDADWWPRYIEHLKRRNAIVHEGVAISRDDATASIDVSLDLWRWLLDARGAEADELDQELEEAE
jgi:hypothetical protein